MITDVPRGSKPCSGCGGPRDRAGQRYCKRCHREYSAHRRAGKIEVLLTPAEWAAVKQLRAAVAERT